MTSHEDPKQAKIAEYIDENLKQVFSELQHADMPDQITDLLSVLRAQDDALRSKK